MQKDLLALPALWIRIYGDPQRDLYRVGRFFVSIYTTSAAVAAYGIIRMDRVCALEGLTATYEVASSCLRGTGKSLEPSVITILGTVVFRLIWLTTIFRMFTTYDMLMNVYVASWLFTDVQCSWSTSSI